MECEFLYCTENGQYFGRQDINLKCLGLKWASSRVTGFSTAQFMGKRKSS